jgi:TonB-dependent receptor
MPKRVKIKHILLAASALTWASGAAAQVADQSGQQPQVGGTAAVPAPTTSAQAPTTQPPVSSDPSGTSPQADQTQDIVVTGYRKSLSESINSKRAATGFTDSVFAEDIGKFPDTNIAESLNRIPGVTINRDVDGEGVNVSIRGLGTNFARITLNGAPIAIASSGARNSQGQNREVDLSFFPTDLFTKLTVSKSYTADQLEGGIAGNIDLRTARPFDTPGTHLTYNVQGSKFSYAGSIGGRGSLIASTTSDTLGILVGVSAQRLETATPGFETIGWTNPALTTPAITAGALVPTAAQIAVAQCRTTPCNTTGGGNWSIPTTVPAGAGAGLVAGTPINQDFLLANNPGATINQIDNGILPRLGRPTNVDGPRDRINIVASAEWRPSDRLHFYVDGLYGYKYNHLLGTDMDWVVRNGSAIPLNTTYDKSDCSAGCTVTGGTYANSQFFLEYTNFTELTHYYGINPGGEWQVADNVKVNLQANYTRSDFDRKLPSVLVSTPLGTGVVVQYANNGGIPSITPNIDLNNPANFGWNAGSRVNVQEEQRVNETKGIRGDVTWGGDRLNLRVGGAYDDTSRSITGRDNSQAYQNAVCGNNPSVFLASPNSQPPCSGAVITGTAAQVNAINAAYPAYPGYGTNFTAGAGTPVTYAGSTIPASAIVSYLRPGPNGYITLDFNRFAGDSKLAQFFASAPVNGGTNTGASGGLIIEKVASAFAEVNGRQDIGGSELRFSAGLRFTHTDQVIGGYVSTTDPRNTAAVLDGGRYPNQLNVVQLNNSYNDLLPTLTLAYDVGPHAVARFSYAKTITRPDPSALLPGVNFSSPSADVGSLGNPTLSPYKSDNLDVGFEYYTGHEGLISFAAFRKVVTGFTSNQTNTLPFSALAPFGITYDSLTQPQQAQITARGGPGTATVQITQQVNASGALTVDGLEFQWVQPLDFVLGRYLGLNGFGFNANVTIIDQKGTGAAPAIAVGVSPHTYNVTAYYSHGGVDLRLTQTYNEGAQASTANQNGINAAAFFSRNYSSLDFSSIFDLGKIFGFKRAPELTVDVTNLTNSALRTDFQFSNAAYTYYKPGRQFLIGLRGRF